MLKIWTYEGNIKVSTIIFESHPRVGDSRGWGHHEEWQLTEDSVPAIMETSEKLESNSPSFKLQRRNRKNNGGGTLGPTPKFRI